MYNVYIIINDTRRVVRGKKVIYIPSVYNSLTISYYIVSEIKFKKNIHFSARASPIITI